MQEMQFVGNSEDDEVRLVDLWRILVRRRAWVLAGLLVCLAVAGAYLAMALPVYEARIKINIGKVADLGVIEEPEQVVARLLESHGETAGPGVRRAYPHIKSAVLGKATKTVLELIVVGGSAQQAHEFVIRLSDELVARHKLIYDGYVRPIDERMGQLAQQRNELRKQSNQLGELVDKLKRADSIQASLVALERGAVAAQLSEMDGDLFEVSQKRIPPATRPTELVAMPVQPEQPVSPKPLLILALALALGLVLGTLAAIAAEILLRPAEAGR